MAVEAAQVSVTIPVHVVSRGPQQGPVFNDDADFHAFRQILDEVARDCAVRVYAYALMQTHLQLLLEPAERDGLGCVMRLLGQRYGRYVAARYRRRGPGWTATYSASLVERAPFLLQCFRYIERAPVHTGGVATPCAYAWSSYAAHALGTPDPLLAQPADYLVLGSDEASRQARYRSYVEAPCSRYEIRRIQRALCYGYPLGSERFRRAMEAANSGWEQGCHAQPCRGPQIEA